MQLSKTSAVRSIPVNQGFTLIELVIAVAIVGILAVIAIPSYQRYVVRASREAMQGELLQLASVQEKIYLNSNGYAASITSAYTGLATGGLGKSGGVSADNKYSLAISVAGGSGPAQSYAITATPKGGKSQQGDGHITVDSNGNRLWFDPSGPSTGTPW